MKKTIKTILFIIFPLAIALGARAQDSLNRFSLQEAKEYAMKNSFVLQNTNMDINAARKKVWETISIGLPQISGSLDYTAFLDLSVSLIPAEFFGGEPGEYIPVKFGQDYNSSYGFTVSQLIFDGSYIVGVSSSQLYLKLAEQANEKTEIDIRNAVTQAYYAVLVAEENKKIMQENLVNTQKLYVETLAYFENGFREEQDVDQMKLIVKNAENEILKAEREISISKVVLKYTMGYDMDTEIFLSGQLDQMLAPVIAGENNFQLDYFNHIDYRLAQSQVESNEKLLKLEYAGYMPRVSAFYNWNKTAFGNDANLFKPSIEWYKSSMLGLSVSIPIFNSGNKMFRVQQAKINLIKAENLRQLAEQTLQKDYLSARADMETAYEQYNNSKENQELSVKILDKAKIKFNNGITSSTELAQLETQYIQSHGAYIGAMMQLLQADLNLKKVTGNL